MKRAVWDNAKKMGIKVKNVKWILQMYAEENILQKNRSSNKWEQSLKSHHFKIVDILDSFKSI